MTTIDWFDTGPKLCRDTHNYLLYDVFFYFSYWKNSHSNHVSLVRILLVVWHTNSQSDFREYHYVYQQWAYRYLFCKKKLVATLSVCVLLSLIIITTTWQNRINWPYNIIENVCVMKIDDCLCYTLTLRAPSGFSTLDLEVFACLGWNIRLYFFKEWQSHNIHAEFQFIRFYKLHNYFVQRVIKTL